MWGLLPTLTNCDTSGVSRTGVRPDAFLLSLREVCRACLARATVPCKGLPAQWKRPVSPKRGRACTQMRAAALVWRGPGLGGCEGTADARCWPRVLEASPRGQAHPRSSVQPGEHVRSERSTEELPARWGWS